jgi:4-amino-4-deoxy-L-arabinose transferase
MVGLFSGSAVLVKWLPGLLIFACWFVAIFFYPKSERFHLRSWKPFFLAVLTAVALILPWQIYILMRFPEQALYEYGLNSQHFFSAIEGHGGDAWFHFNAARDLYGSADLIPFILIGGLIVLIRYANNNAYRTVLLSAVVFTYAFYTLAATKMTSFTIIVAPIAFIGLATLVDKTTWLVTRKSKGPIPGMVLSSLLALPIAFFMLNTTRIAKNHTTWKPNDNCGREIEMNALAYINALPEDPGEQSVVFCPVDRVNFHISLMYFKHCIAYSGVSSAEQIAHLKNQGFRIFVLDNDSLPSYLKNDWRVYKVRPRN